MKKLTALVIGLVAGLSLSSAQTVTTYVFESNVQEELNYDKASDSFVATNNYYDGHFTVHVSPYKLTLSQDGVTVFEEVLLPAKQVDLDNWKIFGFYNPNNQFMTVSVLLNKDHIVEETGEYGLVWICERVSSGPVGVSIVLNKLVGTSTRNVNTVQGLE